jgi:6-phospho-beta-glucosidase
MALRTAPAAVEQARTIEKRAAESWIVSFTNPAGLVTQAITTHTKARAVGICDTPAELFFRIALALHEPVERVRCDYIGLNHLGWVRGIYVNGENVTDAVLRDEALLRRLYPAELFPPELIRETGLIPTEYVYFYLRPGTAVENLRRAGVTRGEELLRLNNEVMGALEAAVGAGDVTGALELYKRYLNRRNASYMRLEAAAESAFDWPEPDWNPFEGATGYHRIAVEAIRALSSASGSRMVLNVPNGETLRELQAEDTIEAECAVDRAGPRPLPCDPLPDAMRGLVAAVKIYERLAIRAAMEGSAELAALALAVNPICGDWDRARETVEALAAGDPRHLGLNGASGESFAFRSAP